MLTTGPAGVTNCYKRILFTPLFKLGLTAEQVQQLVQAAVAGATQQHAVQIAGQLGATKAAVLTMLRTLGHDDVAVELLPNTLGAVATQILSMRQALAGPGER